MAAREGRHMNHSHRILNTEIPCRQDYALLFKGKKTHTLNLSFELWVLVEDFNLFLPIELVFPVGDNLPEMH